jgi:hypothetical protein
VNITVLGAGFAMVEGMLFLLLQEMKASTLLCGFSVVPWRPSRPWRPGRGKALLQAKQQSFRDLSNNKLVEWDMNGIS